MLSDKDLCKFKYYLSLISFFHKKNSHIESKKSDERKILCILNQNTFSNVLVSIHMCSLTVNV